MVQDQTWPKLEPLFEELTDRQFGDQALRDVLAAQFHNELELTAFLEGSENNMAASIALKSLLGHLTMGVCALVVKALLPPRMSLRYRIEGDAIDEATLRRLLGRFDDPKARGGHTDAAHLDSRSLFAAVQGAHVAPGEHARHHVAAADTTCEPAGVPGMPGVSDVPPPHGVPHPNANGHDLSVAPPGEPTAQQVPHTMHLSLLSSSQLLPVGSGLEGTAQGVALHGPAGHAGDAGHLPPGSELPNSQGLSQLMQSAGVVPQEPAMPVKRGRGRPRGAKDTRPRKRRSDTAAAKKAQSEQQTHKPMDVDGVGEDAEAQRAGELADAETKHEEAPPEALLSESLLDMQAVPE